MRRVVSLYLPSWPTDRVRRTPGVAAPPPDVPLALIGRIGRRRVVVAADALARWLADPTFVAPPGAAAALLAPLPVAALRLPPGIVVGLRALGLERIGELAAQPRAPLALRFGPEVGRRLDQALGRLVEPITPARPAEPVEVHRVFAEPIGAVETIERHVARLVARLCAALERRGLGARRLDLIFTVVDAGTVAIRVGVSRPSQDHRHLTRLLCARIETIDPGFGVERMRLSAPLAEPTPRRQTVSGLVGEPARDLSDLIDTLANRLGARRVYRVQPVESDVPERAVRRIDPLAPDEGAQGAFKSSHRRHEQSGRHPRYQFRRSLVRSYAGPCPGVPLSLGRPLKNFIRREEMIA